MIRTKVETCREYCSFNFCKIKDPKQSIQQEEKIVELLKATRDQEMRRKSDKEKAIKGDK